MEPVPTTSKFSRVRCPEKWQKPCRRRNKAPPPPPFTNSAEAVLEGQKLVAARRVKKPCTFCRFECSKTITWEQRFHLHQKFWSLTDKKLQRQFVLSHMEPIVAANTSTNNNNNNNTGPILVGRLKRRNADNNEVAFYFTFAGRKIRVCKIFFLNTLDICEKFLWATWRQSRRYGII